MPINHVVVQGNLTGAPEQSGAGPAKFTVAFNTRVKNKQTGEWEDGEASFFDVIAWGKLAEQVVGLEKGSQVLVVGRLQQERWEKDGQKRSKVVVVAEAVSLGLRSAVLAAVAVDEPEW